ncbi:DUF349 domain-containing protein [Gephyromycinifex aptenodytis]|uniref:DUF349 domain-containing protein n=1 Tax=Gephyromycinifex aptenodytis TaxID=2716227 RepID=UPI001D018FD2|nr:DUF349 domain-containing protein [Gephyromycinifex aptenodytis]
MSEHTPTPQDPQHAPPTEQTPEPPELNVAGEAQSSPEVNGELLPQQGENPGPVQDAAAAAATAPSPTILAGDPQGAHTDAAAAALSSEPSSEEQPQDQAQDQDQDQNVTAAPGSPDADDPAPQIAAARTVPSPGGMPAAAQQRAPAPVPSPAQLAAPSPASVPSAAATPTPVPPAVAPSTSGAAAFGRVAEDGTVFVRTPEGEREVGSYPGASPEEALGYFARKFDEVVALAELLHQRVTQTDLSAKDATEGLTRLRETLADLRAVGDLAALQAKVDSIAAAVEQRRATEATARAAAREEALAKRERIVSEAETIAAQPEQKVQWKASSGRMRALLDEWKAAQREGPKLERDSEQALWHRLSAARNSFDKMRRVHFAQLGHSQAEAKAAKEELVAEAEQLADSDDWGATAGAFKRLMDRWRQAGRAARADDDALWERFKAAQDRFFAAKDAVVAAENEEFTANLAVKEQLLAEGQAIISMTDLEAAKKALRALQEKWDAAGKVPRSDMERVEKGMRRIEQSVRDAEDRKWKKSDPEVVARARSLATQLEAAVAGLREDLAKAQEKGNERAIAKAREALEAREAWLAQARAGLEEFGG